MKDATLVEILDSFGYLVDYWDCLGLFYVAFFLDDGLEVADLLWDKYPCEQYSRKKYILFEVYEKSLNSTTFSCEIDFQVLT